MKKGIVLSLLLAGNLYAGTSSIESGGTGTISVEQSGTGSIKFEPPSAVVDITTNLAYYWKLDENTGTSVGDSADSNTGTFNGTPSWITGKTGSALRFTSTGPDYVDLASVSIGNTSVFSISLWFRDNGGTHDNAEYGEGNTGSGPPILLIGNNQGSVGDVCAELRDDASNDSLICYAGSLNDNVWHHVVYNRYSNSSAEMFVDGVSRGTDSTTVGTRTFDNARIGSLGRLTGGFTDADADQIRIYTGATLTQTQIDYIYANGL